MHNVYDVIRSVLLSENAEKNASISKYVFYVDMKSNKIDIKKAIEHIYSVKVKSVRTLIKKGKKKRVRYRLGKVASKKKAIITLLPGYSISFV